MGTLSEDLIKLSFAGAIAEEAFSKHMTCSDCGKNFDKTKGGNCMKGGWGTCYKRLCPDCMNVCRKCKKVFCSKHIDNHKCK